ncbi:MAG: hypothetical protein IPP12_17910 [Nitrospira sp.]|nr:hypothetical protein [Nitrospira sp.]
MVTRCFRVDASGMLTLVPPAGPVRILFHQVGQGSRQWVSETNGRFLYSDQQDVQQLALIRVEPSGLLTLIPPTGSIRCLPVERLQTTSRWEQMGLIFMWPMEEGVYRCLRWGAVVY